MVLEQKEYQQLFLEALCEALWDRQVVWKRRTKEEWAGIFALADVHHVLPMVYEAVAECEAAKEGSREMFDRVRKKSLYLTAVQRTMTEDFVKYYKKLNENGVFPVVVKGIVCRSLYPKPDERLSADEDLFLDETSLEICTSLQKQFQKEHPGLQVELHTKLFPDTDGLYRAWNEFLEEAKKRTVRVEIEGISFVTLDETDHLLYLVAHAWKHFRYSGFGIRQVCDLVKFADVCTEKIDWEFFWQQCEQRKILTFAAALFQIGEKYLDFEIQKAYFPGKLHRMQVDVEMLLEDLLLAGVHGKTGKSRQHSALFTSGMRQAQDKMTVKSVFLAIFPPAEQLQGRFPYLKQHPYALPCVWMKRLFGYAKEGGIRKGAIREVLDMGKKRCELLKQYEILPTEVQADRRKTDGKRKKICPAGSGRGKASDPGRENGTYV